MNRSIASIVGIFGVLKAGATYVPIDPLCPPSRLGYIVNKCGIKSVLTTHEKLINIEQTFPSYSPLENILVMNGLNSNSASCGSAKLIDWKEVREILREDPPNSDMIDSDVAYILFTSGSTGNPKGVMLSHLNSLTFVNSACHFFQVKESDRFSNICPLHFDMSVFDLFVAFKAGAAVVIIPETTAIFPVKLAELIAKYRISIWNSVPSTLSLLATYKNLDSHDLSSLRLILFAGEQFTLKYLRRLREAIPEAMFCNMYGQTQEPEPEATWVDTGVTVTQLVGAGVYRVSGVPTITLNQAIRLGGLPAGETVFTGYWPTTGTPSDYIKISPHVTAANGANVWKWA